MYDKNQICIIQAYLENYFEELMEKLCIKINRLRGEIRFSCPVHGGRKQNLTIYENEEEPKYIWKCYSKHCEQHFQSTLIGLARGVLSAGQGWKIEDPKVNKFSFVQTLDWLCSTFKIDLSVTVVPDNSHDFCRSLKILTPAQTKRKGINRKLVRERLAIPSKYYADKYSKEILDKMDIGDCYRQDKPMYERAVVPVYDETGNLMCGCTGRALNGDEPKWKHSNGFSTGNVLYNLCAATLPIQQSREVILTEGPMDCVRLVEAGINNVVSVFGSNLTDRQSIILEKLPIRKVILMFDNDDAGRMATNKIANRLSRSYNVSIPTYDKKDPGELTIDEVKKIFGG